jgi:hypothetical protein
VAARVLPFPVVRLITIYRHRHAHELLYVVEVSHLGTVAEGDCMTLGACPCGSADPVHVGLGLIRQLEVDYVGDVVYVDAATRHVGGHENLHLACLEITESTGAGSLALVTVY